MSILWIKINVFWNGTLIPKFRRKVIPFLQLFSYTYNFHQVTKFDDNRIEITFMRFMKFWRKVIIFYGTYIAQLQTWP